MLSSYKQFLVFFILLFLGIIFSGCKSEVQSVKVLPREKRPNIILILADDLDKKLGTTEYMPNLKTYLIDRGVEIDDFLITTPMCCPSRINLLRSQYTHNHTVYNNSAPNGGFLNFLKPALRNLPCQFGCRLLVIVQH